MKAKDIMTKPVISVGPSTGVRDVAKLLLKHRISALPVINARGQVIGMVSEGDLMRRPESGTESHSSGSWWLNLLEGTEDRAKNYLKSHGLTVRDVMTKKVITVNENTPLEKIATLLERNHIKRVPVLHRGKLVGIASRANLLHGLVARDGKAAKSTRPNAMRIRDGVMAEFRRINLNTNFANVVVADGVVHLWGLVESTTQRKALALAAKNVQGVTKVENHLSVQLLRTLGWE